MGRTAKVVSIDAVGRMTAALQAYGEEVAAALADLELEMRRAVQWVQQDRKLYWAQEVRQSWDRVGRARQELQRHRLQHKVAGHEPGCREEKKALDLAKRRLRTAEEKVEAVRRWSHLVEKEASECPASVNQLGHWLQADLPRAVASLQRISAALESYVRLPSTAEASDAQRRIRLAGAGRGQPPELESSEADEESAEQPATDTPSQPPPGDDATDTAAEESQP